MQKRNLDFSSFTLMFDTASLRVSGDSFVCTIWDDFERREEENHVMTVSGEGRDAWKTAALPLVADAWCEGLKGTTREGAEVSILTDKLDYLLSLTSSGESAS